MIVKGPAQIAGLDTIGGLREGAEQSWALTASEGRSTRIVHRPRLLCSDYAVQLAAVAGGVGIALLPLRIAWRGLEDGSLLRVAKEWGTPEQVIHLVFVSRRGMLPAVRALIDAVQKAKPAGAKGTYIKKVAVSSTMGPGVKVETQSLTV